MLAKLAPKLLRGMKEELKKGAIMKATQSFAQDRGTGTTPAAGAKAAATQVPSRRATPFRGSPSITGIAISNDTPIIVN